MNVTTALLGRREVAYQTMEFDFKKPPSFRYKAGQALDLTLPGADAAQDGERTHTFTIESAPSEARLRIATRMRDSTFKRILRKLPLGSPVEIQGPFGSLTLHQSAARPAVMITGGIGITPFYSILKEAAARRLPHTFYLFWANHRPQDAAFLEELRRLTASGLRLTVVPTMTKPPASQVRWAGVRGHVSAELLREHVPDLQRPVYYVAGPPKMVGAMLRMLKTAGVPKAHIRSEDFSGY